MSETSISVLITGASRGIGCAIAIRLSEMGWDIGINFLSNRDAALEVQKKIAANGQRAELCPGDMGTEALG